ncbi:MAG TPA: CDP-alcohol phosphatidyltransferase family protein [Candidatus Acidoferrales bacterium]|nr:CDP-alcohol phosphatidyltransferase family protein [Candidatus Acidoferrales bacterium]
MLPLSFRGIAMFIEAHLRELRRQRFSPPALVEYVRAVGAQVRAELLASPAAVRAIWTAALVYFLAAFLGSVALTLAGERELATRFFVGTAIWTFLGFSFVTLYIGLLRNAEGYRLSALNVPLLLTLLRVSLVPGICLFLERRRFPAALALYVVAASSDVLDGWLARRWRQTTRLGTVMDPLVDIVFNLAMLWGLTAAGLLSRWVFWVGVLRYAILAVGGAGLYVFVGPVVIRPTIFGRLTGVVMTSLIALFTLLWAVRGDVALGLTRLTEIALGVLLAATTVQIVLVGWYNLRTMTGAAQAGVIENVRWRTK